MTLRSSCKVIDLFAFAAMKLELVSETPFSPLYRGLVQGAAYLTTIGRWTVVILSTTQTSTGIESEAHPATSHLTSTLPT